MDRSDSRSVTFPNRPLPPSTALYTQREVIQDYICHHVRDFNLSQHIHLEHDIQSIVLTDSSTRYPWTVTYRKRDAESNQWVTESKRYTTIIVGTGVTPAPRLLSLPGQDAWLGKDRKRQMFHSMWYRTPDFAKDKTVIVIGYHPSGAHVAKSIVGVAKRVCFLF